MIARLGTGATLAGLLVAATIALAEAGSTWLAIACGVLSAVVLLTTLADRLPGLHRLPVVGAPSLTTTFSINDDESLEVSTASGEKISVVLRAGVRNDRRADIADAAVNFLAPENVELSRCDPHGNPIAGGTILSAREPLAAEGARVDRCRYWAGKDFRFSGRSSDLLHFKLELPRPGEYPIRFKVSAEPLYREHEEHGVIRVVAEEPPPRPQAEESPAETSGATTEPPTPAAPRRQRPRRSSALQPETFTRGESLEEEIRKEIAYGERLRQSLQEQGGHTLAAITRTDVKGWEERVAYMFDRHDKDRQREDFLAARPPSTEALPSSLNLAQVILRSLYSSSDLMARVDAKLVRLSKIAREL